MNNFRIRRMNKNELELAIAWANKEGWNPGLHDAESFYYADPNGFFIGLLNNLPIATGSAIVYDAHFAFCGLYIVDTNFRNQGYGIELTQERLRYTGNRITGLDGVINMATKYEKLGYVAAHKNIRFELTHKISIIKDSHIVDLKKIDFEKIFQFDCQYFPAARYEFLKHWIRQPDASSLGYVESEQLKGYGVIRKCHQGYKIGPLFAQSPFIAECIFAGLCENRQEGSIYLDIPDPNLDAHALVQNHKMSPVFEVLRMYRNGQPKLNLSDIFGITTFELG